MDERFYFLFRNFEPVNHQILSRTDHTLPLHLFKAAKATLFRSVITQLMKPLQTKIASGNRVVKFVITAEAAFACSWKTSTNFAML